MPEGNEPRCPGTVGALELSLQPIPLSLLGDRWAESASVVKLGRVADDFERTDLERVPLIRTGAVHGHPKSIDVVCEAVVVALLMISGRDHVCREYTGIRWW